MVTLVKKNKHSKLLPTIIPILTNLDLTMTYQLIITDLSPQRLKEFSTMPVGQLADLIESSHHDYIRTSGPQLIQMANELLEIHSEKSEAFSQLASLVQSLVDELTPHLFKEEQILFPAIRNLEIKAQVQTCFGYIGNPIRVMLHEHSQAEQLVLSLQQVTNNFQAPDSACETWVKCYQLTREFCQDLVNHIYVENEILFPRSIELAD